jgi:hypothetical protein
MKIRHLFISGENWLSRITKDNHKELNSNGITDVDIVNMDDNPTTLTKFLNKGCKEGRACEQRRSASD